MKPAARAAAVALSLSPMVYAVLDRIEAWRAPESDPSLMIRAEHYAFLGRMMVTSYVTVLLVFAALRLRPSERTILAGLGASSVALLLEGALRS